MAEAVKVIVRCRPTNKREADLNSRVSFDLKMRILKNDDDNNFLLLKHSIPLSDGRQN